MSLNFVRHRRSLGLAAAGTVALAASLLTPAIASAGPSDVTLPPSHAGFDYQIGGAYTPPAGVDVVSRDRSDSPAAGKYNICYVNAFQVQPGAEKNWDSDLLLRDANGEVVYDDDWGEALLDVRTADKRQRVAAKVNTWIDECASKGFDAVEPDNFDSFSRSGKLLRKAQAQSYIKLLSAHAHDKGLAIAQKNTSELSGNRVANGLDFAIAEECGRWDECDQYTSAFGDHVIVIEYTADGLSTACEGWGDELSIVRRDLDVSPVGSKGYVRETC
ncbi:endo alpha-1,4 polygalactosaminidase [Streptomyces sp. NPDC042319]|uniref:endo alpha-1,4 polygalactosaminidase n=1 Tax=Streptomyces sp. NPDC042319 TaxID=3154332 RepID=UPI0034006597